MSVDFHSFFFIYINRRHYVLSIGGLSQSGHRILPSTTTQMCFCLPRFVHWAWMTGRSKRKRTHKSSLYWGTMKDILLNSESMLVNQTAESSCPSQVMRKSYLTYLTLTYNKKNREFVCVTYDFLTHFVCFIHSMNIRFTHSVPTVVGTL